MDLPENKKIVLVPGQVEDDASIRFGAKGMTNLALLQRARENAPDAYIVFKPHPDVLAGNRVGKITEDEALKYCDRVVTQVSLDSVLRLSEDAVVCDRRQRVLGIDELTAATLLLYPRYIDPLSKELCEVEVTLEGLQKEKARLDASALYRVKVKARNFVSRKSQLIWRLI